MKTLVGRATLVDILSTNERILLERAAACLWYRFNDDLPMPASAKPDDLGPVALPTGDVDSASSLPGPLAPVPYLRLVQRRETDSKTQTAERERQERLGDRIHNIGSDPSWLEEERAPPERIPLCSWPRLVPLLRSVITELCESDAINMQELVTDIANGEMPRTLPRRRRRIWPRRVVILEDRGRRLLPYWDDHREIINHLVRVLPIDAAARAFVEPKPDIARLVRFVREMLSGSSSAQWVLLLLGDLGTLARPAAPQIIEVWCQFGRVARRAGGRPVCLTASPRSCIPDELRSVWQIVHLDQGPTVNPGARSQAVERLLGYLAGAVRVEPGFLRAVRRLPGMNADAGSEAEFWQHAGVLENSFDAATLDQTLVQKWQEPLHASNQDLIRQVQALWRQWHIGLAPEIWAEEISSLSVERRALTPRPEDKADAKQFFDFLAQEAQQANSFETNPNTARWFRRVVRRLPSEAWRDEDLSPALHRLWQNVSLDGPQSPLPPHFRPELIETDEPRKPAELIQQGGNICLLPKGLGLDTLGSPLARIDYRSDRILVDGSDQNERPFWAAATPPVWASDWGRDDYGPWVEFAVADANGERVTQRLRWIPPGAFLMGSPEEELGRDDKQPWNEGPRHEVYLTQGYWLFDTPVTQALWVTAMGGNPSQFVDPKRPVDQVSWDDAGLFLERINDAVAGLNLTLLTEAQWEYACRAGTETPNYMGGESELAYIAWFDQNSRGQTQVVGVKRRNSWGLYDMLGNVWEWCADDLRRYGAVSAVDPIGPLDSAKRALRGGSWDGEAPRVRAASRVAHARDAQNHHTGFRCARVRPGAEPAETGANQAERQPAPAPHSKASRFSRRNDQKHPTAPLPVRRTFVVRSDCETLTFAPMIRPNWASGMARDRYGIWVEFTIAKVTQRMRWIGPGRFRMGAPEREEGRNDRECPQHEVRLTNGFWLFDAPVTQALWTAVMDKNPSQFQGDAHPVERVSWDDAHQFLERVSKIAPGVDLTFPTEAQWEYACRAGTITPNYAGGAEALKKIAWFGENRGRGTHPVSKLEPNTWGLYDMLGNVLEWCADGRRSYEATAAVDPVGPLDGTERAIRGSAWYSASRDMRAAYRSAFHSDHPNDSVGFRGALARE